MKTDLAPNYTPMVGSDSILKILSMNCMSMQDFPTPKDKKGGTGVADNDVLE